MMKLQNIRFISSIRKSIHSCSFCILFSSYTGNEEWYQERGIEQKLILMSIKLHEQLHNQAVKVLSDEEFLEKYKISKYELIFNKKFSQYG